MAGTWVVSRTGAELLPRTFVLTAPPARRERRGHVDLYLPDTDGPRPAVVLVHGGPVRADRRPRPRDAPNYVGYGNTIAARGAVAVTVEHRLSDLGDYSRSEEDLTAAIDLARAHSAVDPTRLVLWAFSGGALLLADRIARPPGWLRCIAATYPVFAGLPGRNMDARYRPIDALPGAPHVPLVLVRVGEERPEIERTVDDFVAVARAHGRSMDIVHVPGAQHGFELINHGITARCAVRCSVDIVLGHAFDRRA